MSKQSSSKRYVVAGLVAGLTAGAGAGFIIEQSGSAGAAPSIANVTAGTSDSGTGDSGTTSTTGPAGTPANGSAPARPSRADRIRQALAGLVTAGTLTPAQVDKIVAALDQAGVGPAGGRRGPAGGSMGGPMGGFGVGKIALDTVAKVLGITTDQLRTDLQSGQTIAAVAKAQNVDVQKIVDALVADAKTALDKAVTAGKLTADQETARLAQLTTAITDRINGTAPAGPAGPWMGGGMGGNGGMGGGRHGQWPGGDQGGTSTTTTTG